MNHLICWEEDEVKKWEMIKKKDVNAFLLNLMSNSDVDDHTIFVIPVNGILAGIWLTPDTHNGNRVDFYNFHKDYGTIYEPPKVNESNQKIIDRHEDKYGEDTKYGWISPEGKYFHCDYQGHINLADRICFGMIDTNNSERYLEEHGWCKILKPLGHKRYTVYVGGKHTITDAQMRTLIDLGLDNSYGLSAMLCKE